MLPDQPENPLKTAVSGNLQVARRSLTGAAMQVLLVDDDVEVVEYVRRELEDEGHTVSVCHDGAAALRAAELHAFDIVVLDVMMPFMDGLEVTRRLRRQHIHTPIVLLTARDAPEEVVRGLEAGADDYLTKPFSFDVLLARIRARTRTRGGRGQRLRFADLTLDADTRQVWQGTRQIALTRTEFAILECLVRASGRVVPRDTLIEEVWGNRDVTYNNLEVFIRFLRAKLDCTGRPSLIHTERGLGYRLKDAPL